MGLPVIFLALLLLESALSVSDDSYEGFDLINPEDDSDIESYLDRQARNGDKFLRFGRAFWDYENDIPYDDREVQRPSRTGSLTGNPQQRIARDKSIFLRFGRSIDEDGKKKREKREAVSSSEALKRHENYLRFGRNSNSNFMRFGRNLGMPQHNQLLEQEIIKQNLDQRNKHILIYLKNLLRQSEENIRHKNGL